MDRQDILPELDGVCLFPLTRSHRGFLRKRVLFLSKKKKSVRLPAEKQEGSPRPAKRDSRSGCQGSTRRARVHRTHASAAALHARRITPKKRRRRKTACGSWLVRWPRCCAGGPARRCGPRTWFMRDRNSDAAPPSVPNYPSQPTAAPPAAASSPTPVLVI